MLGRATILRAMEGKRGSGPSPPLQSAFGQHSRDGEVYVPYSSLRQTAHLARRERKERPFRE